MAAPMILAEGVSCVYGAREKDALAMMRAGESRASILDRTGTVIALNDVGLRVDEGELVVVMGLSGSGKSTLLRCLNRLVTPARGSIRVAGQEVMAMGTRELREFRRRTFGMVFQHFALFPHRTVLENVEFGLEVQGVARAARRRSAETALDLVGLAGWEGKRLGQLSGGMKQRAGLARALAADASILLMDEAFSALDPLIRRDMQGELVALQRRLRKTIVFVSHDLDEAIALGGRIALMMDGAIVQDGTAESILAAPATPYVRRFVEHIDVSGVLRVGTLTDRTATPPPVRDSGPRAFLRADMTLREALPLLASEPDGLPVLDAAGCHAGVLWRTAALSALARRPHNEEPAWTSPSPASRSMTYATAPSTG
jgi:glycine betaine/proline transport system ATP-binding protein